MHFQSLLVQHQTILLVVMHIHVVVSLGVLFLIRPIFGWISTGINQKMNLHKSCKINFVCGP